MIQSLIQADYKLHEIYAMTIEDVEFLADVVSAQPLEKLQEEEIVPLDQAFPFLFN